MGTRIALAIAIGILIVALAIDFGSPSKDVEVSDRHKDAIAAAVTRNREISASRDSTPSHSDTSISKLEIERAPQPQRVEFKQFKKGATLALRKETSVRHSWLEKSAAVDRILESAASSSRGSVFGWVQIAPGSDRSELNEIWGNLGVQTLGFTGEFARVRFPDARDSIESITAHPAVIGLGIQPGDEKISPKLKSSTTSSLDEIPVLISLMEDDVNGTWRTDLEALRVVVGEWLPYARAYSANVRGDRISMLADLDYVSEIEPIEVMQVRLDTAVPTMGVDGLRTFDESMSAFSGATGESIAVGIIDTGLNIAHRDISTNRSSICGGNFYPDEGGDGQFDLWSDFQGHGTHVTGIIAGNGSGESQLAGMAPGIQHIRIAKVLDREGSGDSVTVANGVRYLLGETGCEWEGRQSEVVKPLILNMSLGGSGERDGRGAANRNIDAVISHGAQLLVIAAGNDGSIGTSNEATAKNVLAVGSITDSGVVAAYSSHGPTADGRLNPHVVGTGSAVVSAKGNSSTESYVQFNGTSMAAPSVSGVAALLMDQNPEFRDAPAYAKARLMSSAVKPSRTLGNDEFPLTNSNGPGAFNDEYGLGLVSANVAIQDSPDGLWAHGGDHGTLEAGESYEYEIEIQENTARLDIVLTWIESPSEPVSPATVVANLDLYLDKNGDCGASDCGEFASTSQTDNVEWIVVKDPEPGVYTVRLLGVNDFSDPVRTGIAWTTIANVDTPTLTVNTDVPTLSIESGDSFELDLEVSAHGFLSTGTTLHMICRSETETGCDGYEDAHWLPSSRVIRKDMTDTVIDTPVGVAVPLGEVEVNDRKRLTLAVPSGVATESHTLFFVASSWNADAGMVSIEVSANGLGSVVQADQPLNDSIVEAELLTSAAGETALDLLLATREPGEPMLRGDGSASGQKKFFFDSHDNLRNFDEEMQSYARHGSVWFLIEAETAGPYRIAVEPNRDSRGTWLAVYEGKSPLDSKRIAAQESTVEFRAELSEAYLVQVWTEDFVRPSLRLTWQQFAERRPENDDFEDRTLLTGTRGVVAGTNYRATLENFEFYGVNEVGASTWFRWIAPEAGRFEFEVTGGLRSFIFDGSSTASLRRVSTMPSRFRDSQFEAAQDREYQIVVIDSAERLVPDYELSWHPVGTRSFGYAVNDMMRDAATIEGETGHESIDSYYSATVEPNEDVRTGVGSIWWRWSPRSLGNYVFQLNGAGAGKLAAFEGTSLDQLSFVADGKALRISTREDLQYWVSIGYRTDSMFADVDGVRLAQGFSWGPAPENDLLNSPTLLTGTVGTITTDHSFATSSLVEFGHIRGHSSLWWRWDAPSTGWQRFELQDWEASGLEEESQQGILAIYHQQTDSAPVLIASSDHSFVINGQAEATIRAEAGQTYLVRVALRTTELGDWDRQLAFSYAPDEIPAWQRYAGRMVELRSTNDDIEDEDLFQPSSISLVGESGLIGIAVRDGLVAYSEALNGILTKSAKIPYESENGNELEIQADVLLHWDSNLNRLYLVQQDAIFEISDPITNASRLTRCSPNPLNGVVPEQAISDGQSENIYVLGDAEIEIYAVQSACEFELLQQVGSEFKFGTAVPYLRVSDLEGARSIVMDSKDARVYAAGRGGLLTFSRASNGTLFFESSFETRDWAMDASRRFYAASVVLASADVLFVVADSSPFVAAFNVSDQLEGENPEFLGLINAFYLSQESYRRHSFYSHVDWPEHREGCTAVSSHSEVRPAVDVFCDGQVFTVEWDESGEELLLSDWFQLDQSDRFGRFLEDGLNALSPKKITENADRNRNYVLGHGSVGTLHMFDRASRITENPYTQ